MWKWLSIRRWIPLLRRVIRLISSRDIPLQEKLLFLIPVAVYWIVPFDAIPFMPLDDAAVTLLLAAWFADRMEKKYKQ